MKYFKVLILVVFPLLAFSGIHKYYISVTEIDYLQEKKSVQITSRIFIDDFENLLKQRYDESIILANKNERNTVEGYIESYLKDKIKIKINGEDVSFNFIGKEYDVDIMICYLEITDVKAITSIEISNAVLFDLFESQQNIVKTKINSQKNSYILVYQNDKVLLDFN